MNSGPIRPQVDGVLGPVSGAGTLEEIANTFRRVRRWRGGMERTPPTRVQWDLSNSPPTPDQKVHGSSYRGPTAPSFRWPERSPHPDLAHVEILHDSSPRAFVTSSATRAPAFAA